MTDLLLATCAALPDGEWHAEVLDRVLAARGVEARWAVWDDDGVDWADALVAVRSTWDYETRREEFLAWAWSVPRLLNGAEALAWNTDKSYLLDLHAAGLPVVPSLLVDDEPELAPALVEVSPGERLSAVVKPRVAAGGRGLVVFDGESGGPDDLDESLLGPGPWVVQPLVGSIRTEGETSVFVLGGEVVSQAVKRPGTGEIRVHPRYGGRTEAMAVTDEAAGLARRAVAVCERRLGVPLDYARVDMVRHEGVLVVGEVELTEPGLYLDVLPANADAFADLVVRRLA